MDDNKMTIPAEINSPPSFAEKKKENMTVSSSQSEAHSFSRKDTVLVNLGDENC